LREIGLNIGMFNKSSFNGVSRILPTLCALGAVSFGLSGCGSLYTETAVTTAGIAGAVVATKVTRNAAVASGIGLAAVAGARAGVQYTQRIAHMYEQFDLAHTYVRCAEYIEHQLLLLQRLLSQYPKLLLHS
jgi:hypothetical protein